MAEKNIINYNKLIRDKVPVKLNRLGVYFTSHTATDKEFDQKIHEKIVEEAQELTISGSIEELADLIEIIELYKIYKGISTEDIDKIRQEKFEKEGGFKDRIILDDCEEKSP